LETKLFGQTTSTLRLARPHQQPQRRDRLHRFAEAHLIGQDCAVPRHQKRHAVELKRERAAGKRQVAGLERGFEVRLEHEEQPLREL